MSYGPARTAISDPVVDARERQTRHYTVREIVPALIALPAPEDGMSYLYDEIFAGTMFNWTDDRAGVGALFVKFDEGQWLRVISFRPIYTPFHRLYLGIPTHAGAPNNPNGVIQFVIASDADKFAMSRF